MSEISEELKLLDNEVDVLGSQLERLALLVKAHSSQSVKWKDMIIDNSTQVSDLKIWLTVVTFGFIALAAYVVVA